MTDSMTQRATPYVRTLLNPTGQVRLASEQLFGSLEDAYRAVRRENPAPEFGAAWKLGGTTEKTRELFSVDRLYFGALHEKELVRPGDRVPPHPLCQLQGEVEVAIRIGADDESFDAWCIALEMPASPVANLLEAGVKALVADRCAAGCLVLSEARPIGTLGPRIELHVEQNGETVSEGHSDNLVDPPLVCATTFLHTAREHGFRPRAGQWIATGGLTPCVPLLPGARVHVFADGASVLELHLQEN